MKSVPDSIKRTWEKTFEVLVEGFSKRSRGQLCGRTEQNKMVVFDRDNCHVGDYAKVRITDSTSATLLGRVYSESGDSSGK
jgi:tRNA-2-methylthio-N6-dimethylallyladenosine synthase